MKLSLSLVGLVLSGLASPIWIDPPAQAQAPTRVQACDRQPLLLPSHSDVRQLQSLYNQYLEQTLPHQDLGFSPEELAEAIALLARQMAAQSVPRLRAGDQQILSDLQRRYPEPQGDLNLRDRDGDVLFSGGMNRAAPAVKQQVLSPPGGSLPAASPPPAISPAPQSADFRSRDFTANELNSNELSTNELNTEDYAVIDENPFLRPTQAPLSTFSVDVDTASYSNVRRFINQGTLPPRDAVRLEELLNYFSYDYAPAKPGEPFSIHTEVTQAPWNPQHRLVQIGLKGREIQQTPPSNLVFLVDVSGSMRSPHKLPLVKRSLCLLVRQLSAQDRISLVVYAGSAGVVLPPTSGAQKTKILEAINRLEAGGSTAGVAGIQLAYDLAEDHFQPQGNNRVILATDGDFNVGLSSHSDLEQLIERKRNAGVYLTVLGFGTGNYKDSKMELLADRGNGNYAYVDTLLESQKVLVHDLRSTLFTIAQDVKLQVEFNPSQVQAYRLIGYENRQLRAQDFNDDRKDAGEIGSGHTVTALYEIIPPGVETSLDLPQVDDLKYQTPPQPQSGSDDLLQVKLRYKEPGQSTSQLITRSLRDRQQTFAAASGDLKFAAAVALYGMLLRDSPYRGSAQFQDVLQILGDANGGDRFGYRAEFQRLVEQTQNLSLQTLKE